MHTNSAALKGTDLVALWFAPAVFALDKTLPPSTFAIGQARRAITSICVIIVRSDNRNGKPVKASPFGQGWELDHVDRPNAPAKPASALEPSSVAQLIGCGIDFGTMEADIL